MSRLWSEEAYQRIVAPFSGTITERRIDKGDLVTAGSSSTVTSLFTLAETASLRVFVDVPQEAAGSVAAGAVAELHLRERPAGAIAGTVARTAGALDPKTRTLKTDIHVPNERGALLPGMYVQVSLKTAGTSPVLLVPASALRIRPQGPEVVAFEGGVAKARPVTLGRDLGKEVEVVGGLTGEESLIASPGDALADGEAVAVAARAGATASKG